MPTGAAIFDRIPDERITATAAKFAQDLLEANRDRLLSNFERWGSCI